jgi:hypothetical protein
VQTVDVVTYRRRLEASVRPLVPVVAAVLMGIIVAGCGGGGKAPGVADVTTTSTSGSQTHTSSSASRGDGSALSSGGPSSGSSRGGPHSGFSIQSGNPRQALKLAECMRSHGVANFPDPNGQGVIEGSGIDPNSPAFQRAQQRCAKDLGAGQGTRSPAQIAQAQAAALAFSKCMRSHGVPAFPDPQFSSSGGGISISIRGKAGGLDPRSLIFQKAQRTCASLLPGPVGAKLTP